MNQLDSKSNENAVTSKYVGTLTTIHTLNLNTMTKFWTFHLKSTFTN